MSSIEEKTPRKKPAVKLINPAMPTVAVDPEPKEENIVIIPKKRVKKEKEEPETCSICANNYTSIIRKKIVCKYCEHDICSKCVEHYLLTRHDDAHCMHCRVNYSDTVLREICTKTYLQQGFFQHRQEVLINRSRSQLPGLQDSALLERRKRERDLMRSELNLEHNQIRDEKHQLQKEYDGLLTEWSGLRIVDAHTPEEKERMRTRKGELRTQMDENGMKQLNKRELMKELRRTMNRLYYQNFNPELDDNDDDEAAVAAVAAIEEKKKEEEKKRFIRRCIRDGCQGFLSQAWKCGMCEWYSCSKCFAVKGAEHDSPHECTAEALETAALIRKNCKPCPKCGEQIEHGGGCSQMWCISCQTPWDWNTGKIVTSGPIHNPLYYEWQRRTGGAVPRNPMDIPCGGYPRNYELIRFPHGVPYQLADPFYGFYRICQEIQAIGNNSYQSHINDQNTNQIHVRFLLKDFDEKMWGRQLAQLEKRKKRDAEIQEVFAAFHMVAIELVNRIQLYRDGPQTFAQLTVKRVIEFMNGWNKEILALIQMINQALQMISSSYCYTVPYIEIVPGQIRNDGIAFLLRYKNFSHDTKKRRPKKDDVNNSVHAPSVVAETDVVDSSEDEEVEEVEEVEEPQQNGYDSDRSTASDIQAAIVASLKD